MRAMSWYFCRSENICQVCIMSARRPGELCGPKGALKLIPMSAAYDLERWSPLRGSIITLQMPLSCRADIGTPLYIDSRDCAHNGTQSVHYESTHEPLNNICIVGRQEPILHTRRSSISRLSYNLQIMHSVYRRVRESRPIPLSSRGKSIDNTQVRPVL